MDRLINTVNRNISCAKESLSLYESIVSSQIEDFIGSFEHVLNDPDEVAMFFSKAFDLPLLSCEFFEFCEKLCMAKRFDTSDSGICASYASVACLFNEYCQSALQSFEEHLNLYVEHENDFNSVCEAVYLNRTDLAMIPLYNTRDGLIVSLFRLLQKYDLRIVASGMVLMGDGNTETEFFLVSNEDVKLKCEADRIFITVSHSADNTISQLLSALCNCGVIVRYINTLPLQYADDRAEAAIIMDVSNANIDAVKLFLRAALPYSTIIGVYPIVK